MASVASEKEVDKSNRETNFSDLYEDPKIKIFSIIGIQDRIKNVQRVCWEWYNLCLNPCTWRELELDLTVDLEDGPHYVYRRRAFGMCVESLIRSDGQLEDVKIVDYYSHQILEYVSMSSENIRRLKITSYLENVNAALVKSLPKFSLLEELALECNDISVDVIKTAGRYCKNLRKLELNFQFNGQQRYISETKDLDAIAFSVGQSLKNLQELRLIGDSLSIKGLKVIFEGCRQLNLLMLKKCLWHHFHKDVELKITDQETRVDKIQTFLWDIEKDLESRRYYYF